MTSKESNKPKSVLRRKEIIYESLNGEEGEYQKSKGLQVETIGFYLRFIGQHFHPCPECSEILAKLLLESNLDLCKGSAEISLIREAGKYAFTLHFLKVKDEYTVPEQYVPCAKCQKELSQIIVEADNLTIGNKDYVYPIELWKRYEIDDSAWVELEKRPSTPEEKERLKKSWFA